MTRSREGLPLRHDCGLDRVQSESFAYLPFTPVFPHSPLIIDMDNLRCNRLTCRKTLTDKAVVVCIVMTKLRLFANSLLTDNMYVYTNRGKHCSRISRPNMEAPTYSAVRMIVAALNVATLNLEPVDCANELFNASRLCPGEWLQIIGSDHPEFITIIFAVQLARPR